MSYNRPNNNLTTVGTCRTANRALDNSVSNQTISTLKGGMASGCAKVIKTGCKNSPTNTKNLETLKRSREAYDDQFFINGGYGAVGLSSDHRKVKKI